MFPSCAGLWVLMACSSVRWRGRRRRCRGALVAWAFRLSRGQRAVVVTARLSGSLRGRSGTRLCRRFAVLPATRAFTLMRSTSLASSCRLLGWSVRHGCESSARLMVLRCRGWRCRWGRRFCLHHLPRRPPSRLCSAWRSFRPWALLRVHTVVAGRASRGSSQAFTCSVASTARPVAMASSATPSHTSFLRVRACVWWWRRARPRAAV